MSDTSSAMTPPIPTVDVVAATVSDLTLLATDRTGFARRMSSPVPGGWPEFPEAIPFTINRLSTHPQEAEWWMHYFFVHGLLIGSGGFVGRPRHGAVEIGYEVAPGFRRRHYGTGAAAALTRKAFATGEVNTVIAHTLPQDNPSTMVLARLGFSNEGEVKDPQQGTVWRWRVAKWVFDE